MASPPDQRLAGCDLLAPSGGRGAKREPPGSRDGEIGAREGDQNCLVGPTGLRRGPRRTGGLPCPLGFAAPPG